MCEFAQPSDIFVRSRRILFLVAIDISISLLEIILAMKIQRREHTLHTYRYGKADWLILEDPHAAAACISGFLIDRPTDYRCPVLTLLYII